MFLVSNLVKPNLCWVFGALILSHGKINKVSFKKVSFKKVSFKKVSFFVADLHKKHYAFLFSFKVFYSPNAC